MYFRGVPRCVAMCDRGKGSKLVQNSVTYFMGGPYQLIYTIEFSLFISTSYRIVCAFFNDSEEVSWWVTKEVALPGVCVVVRRKTGFGWHTVFQQATQWPPNTVDDSRGIIYGAKRLAFVICCFGVQVGGQISFHQENRKKPCH